MRDGGDGVEVVHDGGDGVEVAHDDGDKVDFARNKFAVVGGNERSGIRGCRRQRA